MTTQQSDTIDDLRAVMLASQRFRQAMADHFGLTISETLALGHLADTAGALTPRELGERMLLGSGTLTAVIDRLTGKGFARRVPNPRDRRSSLVELTTDGRRVVRYVQHRMQRALTAASADGAQPRLALLAAALDSETDRALRS